ncbi:MAG: hypothetical protein ABL984_00300 [Pyrinomonadaceae bacterium]
MSFGASVSVEKNKLPELAKIAAREIVDAAARELGFEVLRRAMVYLEQQVYTRPNVQVTSEKMGSTPEPTGALVNSGYLRTFTGELPIGAKSEADALSSASSKNSEVTFGQAPPGPARLGQVQVLFAVEYGLYVEMGTILGMVARPFLRPAAEEVEVFAAKFVTAKLREAGFS